MIFSYRVTLDEGSKELVQGVEVLDIVLGLVGCISDASILRREQKKIIFRLEEKKFPYLFLLTTQIMFSKDNR